jgi:hypothetical protein
LSFVKTAKSPKFLEGLVIEAKGFHLSRSNNCETRSNHPPSSSLSFLSDRPLRKELLLLHRELHRDRVVKLRQLRSMISCMVANTSTLTRLVVEGCRVNVDAVALPLWKLVFIKFG